MMKIPLVLLLCGILVQAQNTLVSKINARTADGTSPESLTLFRDALQAVGMLDGLLSNATGVFTVFAPTNAAIKASPQMQLYMLGMDEKPSPRWKYNLIAALRQHIVPDVRLNSSDIFDLQVTELASLLDPIAVSQFSKTVQGAALIESDVIASNGVLQVVSSVIRAKFFDESFAQLELQSELGPDDLQRVALTDVVDFVGAREKLNVVRDTGTTFLGCRIRAFNRLDEYLPQTINGSPDGVIKGEFLNETNKIETIHNLIDFSTVPKNYYNEDIVNNFEELTLPLPNCGHMWVTKNDGMLCFNNGCVVETPDPREYIASNGYVQCCLSRSNEDIQLTFYLFPNLGSVGYVVDKCLVCPGVAMLVDVAAVYTKYNLKDTAELFRASEWNLRDLRQSVGDGSALTLFASILTGWSFFNQDDQTRLSGDEWKPHQLDLLSHMLVQGVHTKEDLLAQYNQKGAFNLTSLLNQTIEVNLNTTMNDVSVAGGEFIKSNIQGVDGYVRELLKCLREVNLACGSSANENGCPLMFLHQHCALYINGSAAPIGDEDRVRYRQRRSTVFYADRVYRHCLSRRRHEKTPAVDSVVRPQPSLGRQGDEN